MVYYNTAMEITRRVRVPRHCHGAWNGAGAIIASMGLTFHTYFVTVQNIIYQINPRNRMAGVNNTGLACIDTIFEFVYCSVLLCYVLFCFVLIPLILKIFKINRLTYTYV